MKRWPILVWILPPAILTLILAILYGPALTALWDQRNQLSDDQLSQVQTIGEELRLFRPSVQFFQDSSRNSVTFEILDVTENDEQEELVSWFRDAKVRHNVTVEMRLEFYEKGKMGEAPQPPKDNAEGPVQGKKLLKRVDM